MADATRSQTSLREMEDQFGELRIVTDRPFADVTVELAQIQDSVSQISRQLVDLLHRNTGQHRETYHAPTRFTKMDLPWFTRDDVAGWVSKCESYFELDKTPEENKVTMASLVLDESSYQWFDGFKSSQNPLNWRVFAESIKIRFGLTLQRPLEELVQLKQTGNLSDY